eukprot:780153_1
MGNGGGNIDPLTKLEATKWKKMKDPSTGREYWYHKDTKQTTWEPSLAIQRLEAEAAVSGMSAMADIEKPVWDVVSDGSDYSTSDWMLYCVVFSMNWSGFMPFNALPFKLCSVMNCVS